MYRSRCVDGCVSVSLHQGVFDLLFAMSDRLPKLVLFYCKLCKDICHSLEKTETGFVECPLPPTPPPPPEKKRK